MSSYGPIISACWFYPWALLQVLLEFWSFNTICLRHATARLCQKSMFCISVTLKTSHTDNWKLPSISPWHNTSTITTTTFQNQFLYLVWFLLAGVNTCVLFSYNTLYYDKNISYHSISIIITINVNSLFLSSLKTDICSWVKDGEFGELIVWFNFSLSSKHLHTSNTHRVEHSKFKIFNK